MGSDGVYRKTEKGRTEIATRANKLGMRERTLLIMVDDKTSRSGLLSRSAHPASADILDSLLAQGFIEVVGGGDAAPSTPAAAVATAAPPTPGPDMSGVEVSLTSASRFACRTPMTLLGPSGDDLTAMVEKAKGAAELATTLEKCRQIVQDMVGKRKADEFWVGVSARLPKA